MKKVALFAVLLFAAVPALIKVASIRMGKQPDGSFIVATGKRIEPGTIAFDGRPIDLALRSGDRYLAVLNQKSVLLIDTATRQFTEAKLKDGASFRGCKWSPNGDALYVSVGAGYIQQFLFNDGVLREGKRIEIKSPNPKRNPCLGGMDITRDGRSLFVAEANNNLIAEINLATSAVVRTYPTQNIPFEVALAQNEQTLVVSNWGGRIAREKEETADSAGIAVVVDPRGITSSGTISIINRRTQKRTEVTVGLHPSGIAIVGNTAYIANAASDSISEVALTTSKVIRSIPIRWRNKDLFGSMPNAIAVSKDKLYTSDGGDNAVSEIDLVRGKTAGFRPAGFFPVGIVLSSDGSTAYVVNTKGNGSVRKILKGKPANAHDFQGTISIMDLRDDLQTATNKVVENNEWERPKPTDKAVYRGAIKHVLYIIKENRTYDQVLGDMPQGDGDKKLTLFGEQITPNHHAIANQFTLFDNAYVSGTNSAEGHQWAMEGVANDYIERFYADYTRSYPADGGDPMAYAQSGFIWDAAAKKNKSVRVYGEFCTSSLAEIKPKPRTWLDAWRDRQAGKNSYTVTARTTVQGLKKYIHPRVIYWPLLMSDQWRADEFIKEYNQFSRKDAVPNLMLLTLPSDHTEGMDPAYPKPASMVADNDLALGRVIEAVSKSPQWKDTAIFVMEDDAQSGSDHVDGHRTVCFVVSPYVKRRYVDSTMYTQISVIRSIELMLGLDPMNKFDATATPFYDCFQDKPDLTPYTAVPNRIPLDDMNPPLKTLRGKARFWAQKSASLNWTGIDTPDPYWLDRIIWFSVKGIQTPYPEVP